MTVWTKLTGTANILLALLTAMPLVVSAANEGAPFLIIGEQLDHRPPAGWKLAWMSGKADGSYIVEYISEDEDIKSWRKGYLAIERLEYPPPEVLQEIEKYKTRLADVALHQFVKRAKETCGGQHTEMVQRTSTFNGVYFAVGGGYCDRYGQAAPFGEGSFIAFAEGKNYFFRLQYGWRPKTIEEQERNIPWRIDPQRASQYLEAIKETALCGGLDQPACRNLP